MDSTTYSILFTAATVAALILATFFFFSSRSDIKEDEPEEPRRSEHSEPVPAAVTVDDTPEESPSPTWAFAEEEGADMMYNPENSEDADGPICPHVMSASDDDTWKVWFDQPSQSKGMSKGQFEDSMKVLGTFNTMADFWDKFSNLMHEKLPTKSNVRVFQSNVRPLWEDPINRDGGKWIVVVPKPKSVGVFNEVLAAMVSNKFNCEISGLVLSKKVREDLVSVWTPSGLPVPSLENLRDTISQLLELHLGLKPEITFMSHDKKNKVQIAGKDKKDKEGKIAGQQATKLVKINGMKPAKSGAPKSPGSTPKMTGVKPKSPSTAPLKEKPTPPLPPSAPKGARSTEMKPKPPAAWGASSTEMKPKPPAAWGASSTEMKPKLPVAPHSAVIRGREGKLTKAPWGPLAEKEKSPETDSPDQNGGDPGWEVVRSKARKDKSKDGRNRYKSL